MNENDIERKLQRQPLAQPAADFDQRMKKLFSEAQSGPHSIQRTVPLWLMAAACLVCAVGGFEVRPFFVAHQSPPTVVYVFPPSEAMTRFLMGAANQNDDFDLSHARVQVINPAVSGGNRL